MHSDSNACQMRSSSLSDSRLTHRIANRSVQFRGAGVCCAVSAPLGPCGCAGISRSLARRLQGEAEGEHSLQVPRQSDKSPLAADGIEPAQQELPEPQH
jgi:hypothetical protein